ncbi:MAG: PilZ domain-containing protein [Bdellovibrionales bacterium]|nr:PilZ domain-containing protein [Bdellovibrionales bacterium]
MGSEDFKNPISNTEKLQLLKSLGEEANQIIQVTSPLGKIQFQIVGRENENLLSIPRNSINSDMFQGEQKLQWVFDKSRFEATGNIQLNNKGQFNITLDKVFRIQRRLNFRTQLPIKWKREINIEQINDNIVTVEGTILDLSLTGCYFITNYSKALSIDDEVYANLYIDDFKEVRIKAIVVRTGMVSGAKSFALKFIDIENFGKETLNNITIKAARIMRDYTRD